jgi:predicted nucleic acid-binding Zn ribbon protein
MKCKICGKEFEPRTKQGLYCSDECRKYMDKVYAATKMAKEKAKRALVDRTRICPICDKPFTEKHGEVYCSDICRKHAQRRHQYNLQVGARPKKKLKGLDSLEKQLKKKGDFFDEYRKWKKEQALSKVDPIILEVKR